MNRNQSRRGPDVFSMEGLEGRQMLSAAAWGPAAKLIGQDLAVAHYPTITGAGKMVDFGGASALIYKDILKKLIGAGVFVSHPSGNQGPTELVTPSLDPGDFSVGSVNLAGQMSSFTQRGAELDLLAPGE